MGMTVGGGGGGGGVHKQTRKNAHVSLKVLEMNKSEPLAK